ncbi:MAG: tRNA (guanosine(46)-N7)-methyltransferase TrmB [Aestuariivirgaceae bacterium]
MSRRYQLYGRRKAKPLRARQRQLVDNLLPSLRIDLPPEGELQPRAIFSAAPDDVWLEIGFGGGEHLAALAGALPRIGFIGAEPFLNGIAKLLLAIADRQRPNIRIFDADARLLLDRLSADTIGRIYVLYPDPWPKRRHAKRRLLDPSTLMQMHRVMKPGAELRLATDSPDYAAWALARLLRHGGFEWLAETARDWREPPSGWTATRYESKAVREGRTPLYLAFRRRP